MSDMAFYAVVAVLLVLAIAGHRTRSGWMRDDAEEQAAWDEEEAARLYRHDEPQQTGPAQHQNLGLVGLVAWGSTIALLALVAGRFLASPSLL